MLHPRRVLFCLLVSSASNTGWGGVGPATPTPTITQPLCFVAPATSRGRTAEGWEGTVASRSCTLRLPRIQSPPIPPARSFSERADARAAAGVSGLGEKDLLDLYVIEERPPSKSTEQVALKSMSSLRRFLEARPVAAFNREAFAVGKAAYEAHCDEVGRRVPVVLDSCCGTGRSTRMLADARPDKFVIGIDRSLARLERNKRFRDGPGKGETKGGAGSSNLVLLRGTCVDLWRSVWEEGWEVAEHYLLYPNPYPKESDLRKRWHGSPGFPLLFALGGSLEVRASWRTYLEEFAIAANAVTGSYAPNGRCPAVHEIPPEGAGLGGGGALTNFEAKYIAAGVPIYALQFPHRLRTAPSDLLGGIASGTDAGECETLESRDSA